MNILDTFFYVFKADIADLEKKEKEAEEAVNKTTKALDQQDKSAKTMAASLLDLGKKVAGVTAAYMSWAAIKAAAIQAADDTTKIADQARKMYLSADELMLWTRAVESAGGSAEGLSGTLAMLAQRTRDPLGALEKVADRFKGLNDRQADNLAKSLGIDQSMVDVLRQGTAGIQAMIEKQKALGEITKEQVEVARNYKRQMQDTNTVLDDVRRRLMMAVLPGMTAWLEVIQKVVMWVRDHGTFVGTFFGVIAAAITAVLIPAIARLTLTMGRAAAAFLMTPLGATIALLMAFAAVIALIVDDIAAFEAGGKSLIGDIAARWPIIGDIVHNIVDALKMLWEIGRAVFQYLKDVIYEPAEALTNLQKRLGVVFDAMEKRFPALAAVVKVVSQNISDFVQGVIDVFTGLFDVVSKVFNFIKDSFVGDALRWAGDKVVDAVVNSDIGKEMSKESDGKRYTLPTDKEIADMRKPGDAVAKGREESERAKAGNAAAAGRAQVAAADASPMNQRNSASIANSISNKSTTKTTTVNTGPITVQTQATDGNAVASALGKSLQSELRKANDEFDNGVAA